MRDSLLGGVSTAEVLQFRSERGQPAALLNLSYLLGGLLRSHCLRQLTDRRRTDEYLHEQIAEGLGFGAHDWSRLLPRFDFMPLLHALVEELQSWDCAATSRSRGVLILDDTPLENFGRKMRRAPSVYEQVKRHFIWVYPLVNLIYHAKRNACHFRLQSKRRTGRKPKTEHTNTEIVLAMELLTEAARRGLNLRAVVFDTAYCAVTLLRHLDDIGYYGERISAKQMARNRNWFRTTDPVRNMQFNCRQWYLHNNHVLPG